MNNLMENIKARLENGSTLNLSKFSEDDSMIFNLYLYINLYKYKFVGLQMYYPLHDAKTMLKVMSFAASYSPRRLILINNHLKDANSIYPLNKTELVYLDLRNNEVKNTLQI